MCRPKWDKAQNSLVTLDVLCCSACAMMWALWFQAPFKGKPLLPGGELEKDSNEDQNCRHSLHRVEQILSTCRHSSNTHPVHTHSLTLKPAAWWTPMWFSVPSVDWDCPWILALFLFVLTVELGISISKGLFRRLVSVNVPLLLGNKVRHKLRKWLPSSRSQSTE